MFSTQIEERFSFYERTIEELRQHAKVWEACSDVALSDKKTYELLDCMNKDEIKELKKEVEKMGTIYNGRIESLEAFLVEKKGQASLLDDRNATLSYDLVGAKLHAL